MLIILDWRDFDKEESTITLHGIKGNYEKGSKSFLLANEALTPLGKEDIAVQAKKGQDNVLTKQ